MAKIKRIILKKTRIARITVPKASIRKVSPKTVSVKSPKRGSISMRTTVFVRNQRTSSTVKGSRNAITSKMSKFIKKPKLKRPK